MKYRQIGGSDLELSAVTFGAWAIGGWMWGGTSADDAIKAIQTAHEFGVTSIDTAPIYGQGASEELVGKAIKNLQRDKIQILTKYGMRWDNAQGDFAFKSKNNQGEEINVYKYASKESIIKECEESLKRLGTDYIDLYQIHWPDVTTPIQESMEAVNKLIEQGKVRYAGVCNYNVEQMQEAQKYTKLVSNQVPYSMVKRDIEKDVVPYAIENHKSIIAYSPLERGLLTGKMKPGHQFADGDHRKGLGFFKDENLKRTDAFLARIKPLADEKQLTLAQLVILWTLQQPGITITLVGARNSEQAEQNAKATNGSLNDKEVNMIMQELNKLELVD